MSIRFTPFTIPADFITKLTPEIIEKISTDDWINELCMDNLSITKIEARNFISNYLTNLVDSVVTVVESNKNYIFGYILEAVCNELGSLFEEVGLGYKYYEKDTQSIIGKQFFEVGNVDKNNKSENFCLTNYTDWESPIILYIRSGEAKTLLQNLKQQKFISIDVIDDIILCFKNEHTQSILFAAFSEEEIVAAAKNNLGYYEKNSSYLSYDSAYIYWLMEASYKNEDLMIFIH
jgi:hypothetical protein